MFDLQEEGKALDAAVWVDMILFVLLIRLKGIPAMFEIQEEGKALDAASCSHSTGWTRMHRLSATNAC